jgi:hypothetical protein
LRPVLVCILLGEWDGGAYQFDGGALGGGGQGDLVEGGVAEGDGVTGQGGQVFEQAAEVVQRLAIGTGVAAGFAVSVC